VLFENEELDLSEQLVLPKKQYEKDRKCFKNTINWLDIKECTIIRYWQIP